MPATRFSFVAQLTQDGVLRDRDPQVLMNSALASEDDARAAADLWMYHLRLTHSGVPVRVGMGRHHPDR